MAEDRPVTPEKQLLKLIEDPKSAGKATRPAGRGLGSWSGLRGMLAGRFAFWKRASRTRRPGRGFDLAIVNRVMALVVVGLLGYVAYDAASSAMALSRPPVIPSTVKPIAAAVSSAPVSPLKESTFYLEKVSSRDIFKEGPRVPAASQQTPIDTAPAEDVSGQFSLVGISWSSNPDVIIENKSEQKTYFVKRGQSVGSGTKLEAVFKDHVILSREGREFELR